MPLIAEELKAAWAMINRARGAATLTSALKGKQLLEAISRNIAALIEELRTKPVKVKRKQIPVRTAAPARLPLD